MASTMAYHQQQPLWCTIPPPTWHQQQSPPQPLLPPPQQPPAAHSYYTAAYYSSSSPPTAAAFLGQQQQQQQQQHRQTGISQQKQQQTYYSNGRPCDLGYESDRDSQQQQQQHQQQQYYQHQQQQQQTLVVLTPAAPAASPSGGGSTCDSARPESPTEAQLAELSSDLAGFSLSGQRPVDMALSQKMEIVWHQRFFDFFSRFPTDTWHLMPVFDPPDCGNTGIARAQWRYFKDQAKVRFICTGCQKAWTSMGGQVVFWIYRDTARNTGYVHFKLYGQKCTDCCPEYYEHAIWYQEEVEKVIENLYHHVGQQFYGQQPQRRRVDRRAGQPRKEHNTGTCQACQENVCRMGQVLRKKMRTEAGAADD